MKHRQFIHNLYINFKTLGIVANQYEFSSLCGRTPAWFSAIKARNLPMTSDALLMLCYNTRLKADACLNEDRKNAVLQLSDEILDQAFFEVRHKIAAKTVAL